MLKRRNERMEDIHRGAERYIEEMNGRNISTEVPRDKGK